MLLPEPLARRWVGAQFVPASPHILGQPSGQAVEDWAGSGAPSICWLGGVLGETEEPWLGRRHVWEMSFPGNPLADTYGISLECSPEAQKQFSFHILESIKVISPSFDTFKVS